MCSTVASVWPPAIEVTRLAVDTLMNCTSLVEMPALANTRRVMTSLNPPTS
jgi:hypothetical protein